MVESVTIYRLWRTFSTKTGRNVGEREKRLRNKEMGTNEFFKTTVHFPESTAFHTKINGTSVITVPH